MVATLLENKEDKEGKVENEVKENQDAKNAKENGQEVMGFATLKGQYSICLIEKEVNYLARYNKGWSWLYLGSYLEGEQCPQSFTPFFLALSAHVIKPLAYAKPTHLFILHSYIVFFLRILFILLLFSDS